MRCVIVGTGLVGARTALALEAQGYVEVDLVNPRGPRSILAEVGDAAVVVLATSSDHQADTAERLVTAGKSVVVTTDEIRVVKHLWSLDGVARATRCSLAVGAAYSPGVSSLLVRWLADGFDEVHTITTARFGTGGPTCAREHHRSMAEMASEVRDGRLQPMLSGTARQLVWFPEPVGAADCFRAGLSEPFLLHKYYPRARRIQALQAATRRDRLTSRFPMLRTPHAEGLLGAAWVEVRGVIAGSVEHRVMGASGPQASGAAAMAAVMASTVARGLAPIGVWSAPALENPGNALYTVARDVRLWTYDGLAAVATFEESQPLHAARKWSPSREIR